MSAVPELDPHPDSAPLGGAVAAGDGEANPTRSQSRISSFTSLTIPDRTESDSTPSCPQCKRMEHKKSQLKKQQEELKRSLREHLQNQHSSERSNTLTSAQSSQLLKVASSGDAISLFKSTKYNGQLGPLNSRLAFVPADSGVLAPQPTVKRLKGDLAKSLGLKNDGCDWLTFHPELNTSAVKP